MSAAMLQAGHVFIKPVEHPGETAGAICIGSCSSKRAQQSPSRRQTPAREVLDFTNPGGLGRGKRNSPPLRGCSAHSASPYSKIPRRSTSRNVETGSKPERCRRNHGWTRIHTDGVEPGRRWVREARPSFGGRSWTSRIPGSIRVHRCSSVVEFLSVCIDPVKLLFLFVSIRG